MISIPLSLLSIILIIAGLWLTGHFSQLSYRTTDQLKRDDYSGLADLGAVIMLVGLLTIAIIQNPLPH